MAAELVSLVHQDKVVFVSIPVVVIIFVQNFVQTTVCYKVSIFINAKVLEGSFPVLFNCWRIDHKNLGVVTSIFYQELLGYHCGNDGFPETDNICKEETVVAYKFLITLNDGIHLVVILSIAFWHVKGVVIICFQNTVGEILHEHFYVKVVR